MSELRLRWLMPATLHLAAIAAQAQGSTPAAAPAARPDPLDPGASVPALSYRSAFAGYRGAGDDKPLSWREANEAVARIGGWRVYAREAQPTQTHGSGTPAQKPPSTQGTQTNRTTPGAPTAATADGRGDATPTPQSHGGHKSP